MPVRALKPQKKVWGGGGGGRIFNTTKYAASTSGSHLRNNLQPQSVPNLPGRTKRTATQRAQTKLLIKR